MAGEKDEARNDADDGYLEVTVDHKVAEAIEVPGYVLRGGNLEKTCQLAKI